jgi:hypothetical protein
VASFRAYYKDYHQWRLTLTQDKRRIANITLIEDTLRTLPDAAMDETYASDFAYMKRLTAEAAENDPIVGQAGFMPSADDQEKYRPCMGGECPIGNLFTDATRWYSGADFSFINSGGIRGQGWVSGNRNDKRTQSNVLH